MKVRLELIKHRSISSIDMLMVRDHMMCVWAHIMCSLQGTNTAMHEEMDEWVQTCYDQEMERYVLHYVVYPTMLLLD